MHRMPARNVCGVGLQGGGRLQICKCLLLLLLLVGLILPLVFQGQSLACTFRMINALPNHLQRWRVCA